MGELRGLDARVTLTNLDTGAGPAAGTSPTQIALLGALKGHRLGVEASGPDADEAVRRLAGLAARGFDEPPSAATPTRPTATTPAQPPTPSSARSDDRTDARSGGRTGPPDSTHADMSETAGAGGGGAARIRGVGASPGVVVGPVRHLRAPAPDLASAPPPSEDPAAEWDLVAAAIGDVRSTTTTLRDATARDVGGAEAGIFDAHLALLADDALLADVRERVEGGAGAAAAWAAAIDRVHGQVAALPDPYLSGRAADVRVT